LPVSVITGLWINWVNQAAPFGVMTQYSRTTKYFIYARKSSESDEKQVQSIEDQVAVLKTFTKAANLQVVDILTEAHSAKEPQAREVFARLIKRIKAGEANGIIVWKIDRLARNPIDGATIQWLLQKGIIQSIRTPDREYRPEDNVLILNIENSMATQYILDLSKNVKRGMQSKIQKGWRPNRAPLGYLNTKTEVSGENYIINDPIRFAIIKKMWELMLTGTYLPQQILHIANHEWGLRTRQTKKSGGTFLSRSSMYMLFTNIFYTGLIDDKGNYIKGKHDPMITIDEFDKVQRLLGKKGNNHPQKHDYAYTGLITCAECQGTVSATSQYKSLKANGTIKEYTLYYCICARKKKNTCSQRQYTNVDILNTEIEETIVSLTVNPKFKEWVFSVIDQLKDSESIVENKTLEMQQQTINNANKQLQNLTQMRLRDMINDDEYLVEKTRIKNEITILELKLSQTAVATNDWVTPTIQSFEFAIYALSKFQTGSQQIRREILSTLTGGLNCTLNGKILNIPKAKSLICVKENLESYESKYGAVEPEKTLTIQGLNPDFDPIFHARLALVDAVRTELSISQDKYCIPTFEERDKAA
jgi:DNA invertase Pin-like site-specific DNA recombinase